MIVPEFWAEARRQYRKKGRQVTVRRFGWSEESQAQAEAMAEARAEEALHAILSGVKLARREHKVAYNGAEGVPIREEVLERHGDAVITRNAYGARCLNTPDIAFADIDYPYDSPFKLKLVLSLLAIVLSISYGWIFSSLMVGFILLMLSGFVSAFLANVIFRLWVRVLGGAENLVRRKLLAFLKANPTWNLRVYRTPAGMRLIATHQTFDPRSSSIQGFFKAVGADPLYVRMCINQNCFRARLTAKPWRIGISRKMKPRPGVWPINPERMKERKEWVREYEARASRYASCKYLESIGSGITDPKVASLVLLHDAECRANIAYLEMA